MDQELKCDSCIHGNVTVNINNKTQVKFTDFGKYILDKEVYRLKQVPGVPDNYAPYETDDNGYTEFQLWQFMAIFGEYLYNGAPQVIANNEILVEVN